MSQNLRKKAARGSRRQSNNASPLTVVFSNGNTQPSSRHTTSDEDVWSETSGDTVDSWASTVSHSAEREELIVNWDEEVVQSVEQLEEKRTSAREEALAKLIRLLSHKYAADLLLSRRETLLDLLNRSIKKDKSYKENRLAAKVMSLLFITLGQSQESMYQDVIQLLKYTIINTASSEVKSMCINTLSLVCFIAASKVEALELLEFFADIIGTNGKSINALDNGTSLTNALNAYGLLYSGLWGDNRDSVRARTEFKRVMPMHVKQLESTTMEVRIASGENIALMFETLGIGGRVEPAEEWDHQDTESDEDEVDYDDIDRLIRLLNRLATDSNRRRGKAERKTQRSAFRDILRTVEEGDGVEEKLKFKKQTIYFSSWAKIAQLNAFRDALGEGLHVHFEENELLQSIFEFSPPPSLMVPKGSLPASSMSFHTAGSDIDTLISKRKAKSKYLKNRKSNKRGEYLEVG
ncbi:hypothetical protein G9A89_007918 [Geosiphon pyriformis]|nr:hypothetical protein G9A89_007918 [Geosiphon pyriformis]